MKKQILKSSMLALAGAVAFAAAGAQASPISNSDYLLCTYKGNTTLTTASGTTTSCWLTLTLKANCDDNHLHIVSAGSIPGDTACSALYLGNFPWGGDLADILAGSGTIETNHTGIFPYSVINGASFTPEAGGDVTGVSGGGGTQNFSCDGNTVTTPDSVVVSGSNNFGPMMGTYATFNTVGPDHLQRLNCTEI